MITDNKHEKRNNNHRRRDNVVHPSVTITNDNSNNNNKKKHDREDDDDDDDSSSATDCDDSYHSSSVVERSIEAMEISNVCVHPVHCHSFQKVTFFLSALRGCAGCNRSLQSVVFGVGTSSPSNKSNSIADGGASSEVVRCIACGVYAHRSCALGCSVADAWKGPVCSVNGPLVVKSTRGAKKQPQQQKEQEKQKLPRHEKAGRREDHRQQEKRQQRELASESPTTTTTTSTTTSTTTIPGNKKTQKAATTTTTVFGRTKDSLYRYLWNTKVTRQSDDDDNNNYFVGCLDDDVMDDNTESSEWSWTDKGPPPHWASTPENLAGLVSRILVYNDEINESDESDEGDENDQSRGATNQNSDEQEMEEEGERQENEEEEEEEPLHYSRVPFASVSRTLQENILAHFQRVASTDGEEDFSLDEQLDYAKSREKEKKKLEQDNRQGEQQDSKQEQQKHVKQAATQVKPPPDPPDSAKDVIMKVTKGTYQVVKKTRETRGRLGIASVAGGIAGGVAGLYIAGPAGAVIGCGYGQKAGVLGLLIEGSVNVGVVVAGVISASSAALRMQDRLSESPRIITMGETGTSRKLLLVRPNIRIDPGWRDIFTRAQSSYVTLILPRKDKDESDHKIQQKLSFGKSNKNVREVRYHRVNDIVETHEEEIPTPDKVLILVSRLLNDKTSYPGYVYRYLIRAFKDRAYKSRVERWERQQQLQQQLQQEKENYDTKQQQQQQQQYGLFSEKNSKATGDDTAATTTSATSIPAAARERRQDTHAVIKYVTASLLDVRPGFASSSGITELAATAVEGLVFGEVYDLVLEEIALEASECDRTLLEKIESFQQTRSKKQANYNDDIDTNPSYDNCNDALDISMNNSSYCNIHYNDTSAIVTSGGDAFSTSSIAVDALRLLPKAYSAVEKLGHCVQFLELVSEHFSTQMMIQVSLLSSMNNGSKNRDEESVPLMGADSLLKMVCQHIIIAKVPRINAEVQFIEEFARDEQLLKGKDGYALVTLQASLHFLNASNDFEKDIFGQDEDEDEEYGGDDNNNNDHGNDYYVKDMGVNNIDDSDFENVHDDSNKTIVLPDDGDDDDDDDIDSNGNNNNDSDFENVNGNVDENIVIGNHRINEHVDYNNNHNNNDDDGEYQNVNDDVNKTISISPQ